MQPELINALLLAALAGLAMPLGAIVARSGLIWPNWSQEEFRHTVVAFGGGALLSAIAFVLVPGGAERLGPWLSLGLFFAGGIVFFCVDYWISRAAGGGAMLLAMLLDFIPESMALGALLAAGSAQGVLLAALIGLQNLPEGFSAFKELREKAGMSAGRIIRIFLMLAALGPLSAWFGVSVLQDMQALLGGIMLFASGGILYLIFEDIAPAMVLKNNKFPPLGAVAGFTLGFAGNLFVGG